MGTDSGTKTNFLIPDLQKVWFLLHILNIKQVPIEIELNKVKRRDNYRQEIWNVRWRIVVTPKSCINRTSYGDQKGDHVQDHVLHSGPWRCSRHSAAPIQKTNCSRVRYTRPNALLMSYMVKQRTPINYHSHFLKFKLQTICMWKNELAHIMLE